MWNGCGQAMNGMNNMMGGYSMAGGGMGGGMSVPGSGMGMGMAGGGMGGMGGMGGGMGRAPKGGRPIEGVDGAWACPGCSNVNFATRTACNRCQNPRPSQQEIEQHATRAPSVRANGAPIEGVDGNWACTNCQNVNFTKREACNRCQAIKPAAADLMVRHAQLAEERSQDVAAGFAPRGMEGAVGYETLPNNPAAPSPRGGGAGMQMGMQGGMQGMQPGMQLGMQQGMQQGMQGFNAQPMYSDQLSMQPLQQPMMGGAAPQDPMLQARMASLEATAASLLPLLPQVADLQAQVAQLQAIVTQQAHVLASANLAAASVPAPSPASGTKRAAEGPGEQEEAKRQELE